MKKLNADGELALIYAQTPEMLKAYFNCYGLEPESEIKLFEVDPEMAEVYWRKYGLSDKAECFLVRQEDIKPALSYFEEWELSEPGQLMLVNEGKPELVAAYVKHYAFKARVEPLLFVPRLEAAAKVYAGHFPLFKETEAAMFALGDAELVRAYIAHDGFEVVESEFKLFEEPFRELVQTYEDLWGFSASVRRKYEEFISLAADK